MKLRRLASILAMGLALVASTVSAQEEFIQRTTPMASGRAFHGAAVLGDYLYVFGGSINRTGDGQEATPSTQVARISDSGHLSNWIETTPIDAPRHYISNSSIVLNDTAYIIGGSLAVARGERLNTVAYTRPQPNGVLFPWLISPPFAESGLSTIASFTTSGYLHLTGGLRLDDTVTNQCWSIAVNPDGTLGQWSSAPSLPEPLWYHCAGVVGGRAYVWGGLHADTPGQRLPSNKVFSAPILASGRLGDWRREPVDLPVGFYSAAAAVAGPYIFSICPRYEGGTTSNDIWWTYVTPTGMQPWQRQTTNLPNQVFHATATDYRRGFIYITGGKPGTGTPPQSDVFFIRLSPDARRAAETQWQGAQTATAQTESAQIEYTGSGQTTTLSFNQTSGGVLPGFSDLVSAQARSSQQRQPLVMYFHVANSTPCQQQLQILQEGDFPGLASQAAFASIEASQNPQLAQQHGVFRVPTWIFFNAAGEERGRSIGVIPFAEIGEKLQTAR